MADKKTLPSAIERTHPPTPWGRRNGSYEIWITSDTHGPGARRGAMHARVPFAVDGEGVALTGEYERADAIADLIVAAPDLLRCADISQSMLAALLDGDDLQGVSPRVREIIAGVRASLLKRVREAMGRV